MTLRKLSDVPFCCDAALQHGESILKIQHSPHRAVKYKIVVANGYFGDWFTRFSLKIGL